jgi:integrase
MTCRSVNAHPSTLASVLGAVTTAVALTARQRRDMASALRVLARCAGCPLDILPSDVPTVRATLDRIHPARHRMGVGRWRNVRALVYKSLEVAGVRRLPGRSSHPVSKIWRLHLDAIPERPYRWPLIAFARYCSSRAIGPDAVDQRVFDEFLRDLELYSGRARFRQGYLDATRAWNLARRDFQHWPKFKVLVQDRRKRYALPWSDFPASLKADIDAMAETATNPDVLASQWHKPLRRVTVESRVRALRAFASALVHCGYRPSSLRSIADLVHVEAVRKGLTVFLTRAGKKKTPHAHNIARLLCSLAKHWVYGDLEELTELRKKEREELIRALERMCKNLHPGHQGMTDKNRAVLRHFEDERVVDALLSLPERHWRQYRANKELRYIEAIDLQIALAIELLTMAPIRIKNLVGLRWEQNVIAQGSGRNRRVSLYFPSCEVKNELELEFELPPSTARMLDLYMNYVRPKIVTTASPFVFPGKKGTHKSSYLLSRQIAQLMQTEVGVWLTAHQFRHVAGFLYLKANPAGHEVVRRFLGHKKIETTVQFYAGMEAAAAIRHYDGHIAKRRSQISEPVRRRQSPRCTHDY